MKLKALVFVIFVVTNSVLSQNILGNYGGVLSEENYFKDPVEYLRNLSNSVGDEIILIDKSLYSESILKSNGISSVETLKYSEFYRSYQSIYQATEGKLDLISFDSLLNLSRAYRKSSNINLIPIIDFSFNRIQTPTNNKCYIERTDSLELLCSKKSIENYTTEQRVVMSSCISHNVFGDTLKFLFERDYIFTNRNANLLSLEIDCGNGKGFQPVKLGTPFKGVFKGKSEYVEVKVRQKLQYEDSIQQVYSHFMVYRKSSKNFPNVKRGSNDVLEKSVPNPNDYFLHGDVEVTILFNQNNDSEKLRRPLVLCDGFDPENPRNYWETVRDNPGELLPKEKDFRGLYELLDGAPSPWYPNQTQSAGMVNALQNLGFDIVFVNFLEGAADIPTNANRLRSLLNSRLNGDLRDSKTEEMILVGPSMGGVITRITLKEMEDADEEHYVKSWISFDAPQKGASIPIGLQKTLSRFVGSSFDAVSEPASKSLNKLITPAAKQLLVNHISNNGSPDSERTHLQSYLDDLGYPVLSKNYSLSNGGKNVLYGPSNVSSTQFLMGYFKSAPALFLSIKSDFWQSEISYSVLWEPMTNLTYLLGLVNDNIHRAPGGWFPSLYSLNYSLDNDNRDAILAFQKQTQFKAHCFIPTVSSLGMEMNSSTILNTWDKYTSIDDFSSGKIRTPFDKIHGMDSNEEHVRISPDTKNEVVEGWIKPEMKSTIRPIARVNENLVQSYSGSVAFVLLESIVFGDNGNTFTFQSGAESNVVSGEEILFKPGFHAKSGAEIHARIESLSEGDFLKNYSTEGNNYSHNYLKSPGFQNKIYDYSARSNNLSSQEDLQNVIKYFPNPTTGRITVLSSSDELLSVFIFSNLGAKELEFNEVNNRRTTINLNGLKSGQYLIKVITESGKQHFNKIVIL